MLYRMDGGNGRIKWEINYAETPGETVEIKQSRMVYISDVLTESWDEAEWRSYLMESGAETEVD